MSRGARRVVRACAAAAAVACMLAAAGCGGKPQRPPAIREKAIAMNRGGAKALRAGDSARALERYRRALGLNLSIDDTSGVVVSLLNMAAVRLHDGDRPGALADLDRAWGILEQWADGKDRTRDEPGRTGLMVETAYRLGIATLGSARDTEALRWALTATDLCRGDGCASPARLHNLRGRALAARGETVAAAAAAARGLELARGEGDRAEEASALRLLASLSAASRAWEDAVRGYSEALAIDKALALPERIAADLIGLGEAHLAAGRRDDALRHLRRAQSVSRASGEKESLARAESLLRSIGGL